VAILATHVFGSQGATPGVALKATFCGIFGHTIFRSVLVLFSFSAGNDLKIFGFVSVSA